MTRPDLALHSDLLVRLEQGGAATAVSLDLSSRPNLTLEQFQTICAFVGRFGSAHKWWVGDLVVQGEQRYGELVYQALESLAMSPEGRQECARVAAAIPLHRRRVGLSWSHHRAVARRSITPRQRDEILDRAEANGWTAREIEDAVSTTPVLHVKDQKRDCESELEAAMNALIESAHECYGRGVEVEVVVRPGAGAELRLLPTIEGGNP